MESGRIVYTREGLFKDERWGEILLDFLYGETITVPGRILNEGTILNAGL